MVLDVGVEEKPILILGVYIRRPIVAEVERWALFGITFVLRV